MNINEKEFVRALRAVIYLGVHRNEELLTSSAFVKTIEGFLAAAKENGDKLDYRSAATLFLAGMRLGYQCRREQEKNET